MRRFLLQYIVFFPDLFFFQKTKFYSITLRRLRSGRTSGLFLTQFSFAHIFNVDALAYQVYKFLEVARLQGSHCGHLQLKGPS